MKKEPIRATYVTLSACDGDCPCHLVFLDENEDPIADGSMTREMAATIGALLMRVGEGEDVSEVLRSAQGTLQ